MCNKASVGQDDVINFQVESQVKKPEASDLAENNQSQGLTFLLVLLKFLAGIAKPLAFWHLWREALECI